MRLGFLVVACSTVATWWTILGCEKAGATNNESNVNIEGECIMVEERMMYRQDEAPTDISGMLQAVTKHLNTVLQDVVKVELTYSGDSIHAKVGEHTVKAFVQRQRENGTRDSTCVKMAFNISDVDECLLPPSNMWHHNCHPSTTCVNTVGSYECSCPVEGEGAVKGSGIGACQGGEMLSSECCKAFGGGEIENTCRSSFKCYVDPCPGNCSPDATCESSYGTFTCRCPIGTYGNGRICDSHHHHVKVEEMVILIDAETGELISDQMKCGSHASCVNKKEGFRCECYEGFTFSEEYGGCMDKTPPELELVGPNPLILKRCSSYEELGVRIHDENSEDYARLLEVDFSEPLSNCLSNIGSFHVNYTISTGLASQLRVTREVVVEDVDECSLPTGIQCDACRVRCHPLARCISKKGSYGCKCPSCMRGDGFLPTTYQDGMAPSGYMGGTGCVDSCAPEITILGSALKEFYVCECQLLGGLGKVVERDFGFELQELIAQTGGLALCDESDAPCVRASDDTGGDEVIDVTPNVVVGEPISVATGLWRVPYDVVDDAGNRAETVYREVRVHEVSLGEYAASLSVVRASEDTTTPPAGGGEHDNQATSAECPKCDSFVDNRDYSNGCDCERDCAPSFPSTHFQERELNSNTQRVPGMLQSAREQQPLDINIEGLVFYLIVIIAAVLLATIAVLVCSIVNGFPGPRVSAMSPPLPRQPPYTSLAARGSAAQCTTTQEETRQTTPIQPTISCISPGSEQMQAIRTRIRRE